MPLPWKKSKSGRISRFVSDLQQSPKHGGSLVVETGFPTSLVDLFVKNRDRLKKSYSKRNNKAKTQTDPTRPRCVDPEDLAASEVDETEERECTREIGDCIKEVQVPPVVLTKEKSKSAKFKSKIVKKIVPKKLMSFKKLKMKEKQEAEGVELVQEDDVSLREVSSRLYSESEISERDETGSNPPLLLSCGESGSIGDLTKLIVLLVIALTGLLSGKVLAIVLTLSSCQILRFVSQTSL